MHNEINPYPTEAIEILLFLLINFAKLPVYNPVSGFLKRSWK